MQRVIVYRDEWLIYADVYRWDIEIWLNNMKWVEVISILYIPDK